jgi:hypothetical protein
MEAIRVNIVTAQICAAIGGAITLAILYDCLRTWRLAIPLPASLLLLAMHPAWTVSAVHGDCGTVKQAASILFTLLFVVLLTWQFSLTFLRRPTASAFDSADETATVFPVSGVDNPYESPRAVAQPLRKSDGVIGPLVALLALMAFWLILWLMFLG